jgi:hypothetical protein
MKVLITLVALLVTSEIVFAIDACSEKGYCTPQGTIHIRVAPDILKENRKYCAGAVFTVNFSLKEGGIPDNVLIIGGPTLLRKSIHLSFKKWRFGAVFPVPEATEKVEMWADCSFKDKQY